MRTVVKTRIVFASLPVFSLMAFGAFAQTAPTPPDQPAAASAPASAAMTTPAMSASIVANPNPTSFDLGPLLGTVHVTGAVSGIGQWQDNVAPGDKGTQADLSNAQLFIQKTDGLVQYYIQVGAYSIPDLGAPYVPMSRVDNSLWGNLPQAYLKIAPSDSFSLEIGKLPTLIGAEYTFSFENLNVERGLLWNQEPAVSRGIQANYTTGPLAVSVSWNDGDYSDRFNWISGLATYTLDPENTVAIAAAGNLGHTDTSTFATPGAQNNETVLNLLYTHSEGPWTFNPYFQYTSVPALKAFGYGEEASSYGFAMLVNYSFDADSPLAWFSLPARLEYIATTGKLANGAANLLYGPGSDAWSFTITPTYQYKVFFARGELSYVAAGGTRPGFALGPNFGSTAQTRLMLETGIVF